MRAVLKSLLLVAGFGFAGCGAVSTPSMPAAPRAPSAPTVPSAPTMRAPEIKCPDSDGDGFKDCACAASVGAQLCDCNDGNSSVFPGAPDKKGDGIDQNCDGKDG